MRSRNIKLSPIFFHLLMQPLKDISIKTFLYLHHSLQIVASLLEVSYQEYIADHYNAKAFMHFEYFSVDIYRKRLGTRKLVEY